MSGDMTLAVWIVALWVLAVVLLAAFSRPVFNSPTRVVSGGPHTGRTGRVVSSRCFGLLCCLNVAATATEKSMLIQRALDRNVGWQLAKDAKHLGENVEENYAHARSWVWVWCWQAKPMRKA